MFDFKFTTLTCVIHTLRVSARLFKRKQCHFFAVWPSERNEHCWEWWCLLHVCVCFVDVLCVCVCVYMCGCMCVCVWMLVCHGEIHTHKHPTHTYTHMYTHTYTRTHTQRHKPLTSCCLLLLSRLCDICVRILSLSVRTSNRGTTLATWPYYMCIHIRTHIHTHIYNNTIRTTTTHNTHMYTHSHIMHMHIHIHTHILRRRSHCTC